MHSRPACYRCLDGHMILWESATPGVSRLSLQVCSLHWPSRSCWRGRLLSCDDLRLLLRSLNSKKTFLSRLPVSIFSPSVRLLLFPHLNNKDIKYAIPACTQTYVVFCFVCFVFVFFFQPKLACMWLLSCSMVSPWKWWSPAAPLRVIYSVSSFLPSFLPDNHSLTSGSLFPKSFLFDSFSCLRQVQLLVHRSETFPTPLPACCDGARGCDGRVVSLAGAMFLPRVCSVSVLAYPLAMSWALIICTKYEINSEKYEI